MSMTVDETTPLTDAERRYLLERGQHDKVVALDAKFEALDAKFEDWDGDEGDEGDEDQVVDYNTWTKKALQAEIDRRVANGREFTLSAKPTVAEYAAALVEDDADGEDDE